MYPLQWNILRKKEEGNSFSHYAPAMKHVLMAGDQRVYRGFLYLIYTMLQHNKNVHFHIFSMDIEEYNNNYNCIIPYQSLSGPQVDSLRNIITQLDGASKLSLYDVRSTYGEYLAKSVNRCTGFTPYTALRLIADKVLPKEIDQVLYLDADIIIRGSVERLYKTFDETDCVYAGVKGPQHLTMNAGVLMLNMAQIRETGIFDKVREYYNLCEYQFPDQEALIAGCPYYNLDIVYNDQPAIENGGIRFDPNSIIRHFTCCGKPYYPDFLLDFPEYQGLAAQIEKAAILPQGFLSPNFD